MDHGNRGRQADQKRCAKAGRSTVLIAVEANQTACRDYQEEPQSQVVSSDDERHRAPKLVVEDNRTFMGKCPERKQIIVGRHQDRHEGGAVVFHCPFRHASITRNHYTRPSGTCANPSDAPSLRSACEGVATQAAASAISARRVCFWPFLMRDYPT
jgi:hypothetical protein